MSGLMKVHFSMENSVLSVSSVVEFLSDDRRRDCDGFARELPLRQTPAK